MKPAKYRDFTKTLRQLGCTSRQGKGDHEMWLCPCGKHSTPITQTREVSPGLVRQAIDRLACLPKEWWS